MEESPKTNVKFDEKAEEQFRAALAKYPTKEAALMPALWLAQYQFGNLSDAVLEYIAERLGISPVRVFAVSEFYTMYHREGVGKFHVQLCRNLTCSLLGSEKLQDFLEKKLGVKPGGKSEDGMFSLELVECLGSCGTAPVMRVNDTYYENLSIEKIEKILALCREGKLAEAGSL
jgi:NADH-quinone oxidoreductase subunit E